VKKYSKYFVLIISIVFSVLIFVYRNQLAGFQSLGLLGLFIISILGAATVLVPVPVVITAFSAATVFNPIWVTVIVSLGATIGELTGYAAGYGSEEVIKNQPKFQRVKKWMDKYGLWTLFALAAIPNPIFDLAGLIAGATKVPLKKYFIIVWAGKLIKFGVIAGSANIFIR